MRNSRAMAATPVRYDRDKKAVLVRVRFRSLSVVRCPFSVLRNVSWPKPGPGLVWPPRFLAYSSFRSLPCFHIKCSPRQVTMQGGEQGKQGEGC